MVQVIAAGVDEPSGTPWLAMGSSRAPTWHNQLPEIGATRRLLVDEYDVVADDWLATQLSRMEHELERHDCAAVDERLQRMRRLLPDRRLPDAMDGCGR